MAWSITFSAMEMSFSGTTRWIRPTRSSRFARQSNSYATVPYCCGAASGVFARSVIFGARLPKKFWRRALLRRGQLRSQFIPSALFRAYAALMDVLDHFNFRQRDEPLTDHFVQDREQLLNLTFRVDDADHDRRIMRKGEKMCAADQSASAVAFDAPQNSRAGNVELAALFHDGAIERLALPFIVLAKMDAQHFCFAFEFHERDSFRRSAPW